jgi:GDPmannose 4,6-dehydratase
MWRILQHDTPDDWVLATGQTQTVRSFVELAFAAVGRRITWQGEGVDEIGIDAASGETLISIDPRYFRPTEVEFLLGDPTKAREKLGWQATTTLEEMVREMVDVDMIIMNNQQNKHNEDL